MSDRASRLELITRLKDNAAVAAAVEELREQRTEYEKNLGRHLIEGAGTVDQREIDFKRGVWYGAMWAYTAFIRKAEVKLEKEIEKALKERGES